MKLLPLPFLLLFFGVSYAQKITTLTCIDKTDPNFQFNISFDPLSKMAFFGDKVYKNAVNQDVIAYTEVVKGTTYKTYIYRDTGRFTVYVSGTDNFSCGGECSVKNSNKF